MFIYSSQLPLLLTLLILVDQYGINSHVNLLIAATIAIDFAYYCGPTLYGVSPFIKI